MKKYRFYPVVHATLKPIQVEAESKEEALELAMDQFEAAELCWSCANAVELCDQPIEDIIHVEEIE